MSHKPAHGRRQIATMTSYGERTVVRIGKGHAEALEPAITERLVQRMLPAKRQS